MNELVNVLDLRREQRLEGGQSPLYDISNQTNFTKKVM